MKFPNILAISLLWLLTLVSISGGALAEEAHSTIGSLQIEKTYINKKPIKRDLDKTIQSYSALQTLLNSVTKSQLVVEGSLAPDAIKNILSETGRRLVDLELEKSEKMELRDSAEADKPTEVSSNTQEHYQRTIQRYETILLSNPDYRANDNLLYQIARLYELMGETDKMMGVLTQLIEKYEKSPFYIEANFRLAERYFVTKDYEKAATAYSSILAQGESSPFLDQATYKYGWTLFKLQELPQAMDNFILLLDRIQMGATDTSIIDKSPNKGIFYDTLRIVGFIFAHVGGHKGITDYFEQKGQRTYEYLVYEHLGEHYERKERIRDSADTYLAFVNLYPAHLRSPELQLKAISAYVKGGFPTIAIVEKEAFLERYKFSSPHWRKLEEKGQELLKPHLRKNLVDLAEHYHAMAQQSLANASTSMQAEEDFKKALYWYRLYLDSFPDTAESGKINFLMADLLFDFKHYSEAIDEYTKASYDYPPHEKSAEAGFAALLAYARESRSLPAEVRKRWEELEVKSALRFSDSYPTDPRLAEVLTKASEQLFKAHNYKLAQKSAQRVIQLDPATDANRLQIAKRVYAHATFELGEFAQAEQAYVDLLVLVPPGTMQHRELTERLAASIYKLGEISRTPDNHRIAAEHFKRVGELAPDSSIRETADYDAANSYLEAEAWPEASLLLEAYLINYPDSPAVDDIYKKQILAYLQDGKELEAADIYTKIADSNQPKEIRREARWNAAEIYLNLDQYYKSIVALKNYIRQFPEPLEQSVEGRQKLADLYDRREEIEKRNYWLEQIIEVDKKATGSQTARIHFLAAKASFILAEPLFDSFNKVELKVPLQKSLRSKQQRMSAAIDAYEKVAKYQVAKFTTAATYRTAEIYRLLGAAMMESERPENLNEEELEQYEILLEEQAYPFEEKAIEVHQANAGIVTRGIYNKWNRLSFAALAKLQPVRYDKQEKSEEIVHALQ